MLTNETAGIEEVAAALGREPSWLARNWLKIHETLGFPRKLPTGLVWPRRAVEAWLRAGGAPAPVMPAANQNEPATDLLSAHRAMLDRRYGVAP